MEFRIHDVRSPEARGPGGWGLVLGTELMSFARVLVCGSDNPKINEAVNL